MCRVFVTLTDEEAVKLHALGGMSWVRLQLLNAAPPTTGLRSMYGLSAAERAALLDDLPRLGRLATARKYRVKPTTVDVLKRNAHLVIDLRRREARAKLPPRAAKVAT